ncbi:amino acid permease [Streptomyces sp. Mg1]|nr:amino acid permease [Streptomyces sp. Mg1]
MERRVDRQEGLVRRRPGLDRHRARRSDHERDRPDGRAVCLNSGLYTASRMAFSLGERGDAPKAFAKVNKKGVPTAAILGSVVFGFVAVYFNYAFKDTVFNFLLNSSGAIALFVWLVICLTQLRMRKILVREAPDKLTVKMWLFPYLTYATAAMITFVLAYMVYDKDNRETVTLSLLVAAVVLVIGVVRDRRRKAASASASVEA